MSAPSDRRLLFSFVAIAAVASTGVAVFRGFASTRDGVMAPREADAAPAPRADRPESSADANARAPSPPPLLQGTLETSQLIKKIDDAPGTVRATFAKNGRRALYQWNSHGGITIGVTDGARWELSQIGNALWSDSGATFAFWKRKAVAEEFFIQKNGEEILTRTYPEIAFLPRSEALIFVKGGPALCNESMCADLPGGTGSVQSLRVSADGTRALVTFADAYGKHDLFVATISGQTLSATRVSNGDVAVFGGPLHDLAAVTTEHEQHTVTWGTHHWGPYASTVGLVFSPAGDHVAYWAKEGLHRDRWQAFVDGRSIFTENARKPQRVCTPTVPPTCHEIPTAPASEIRFDKQAFAVRPMIEGASLLAENRGRQVTMGDGHATGSNGPGLVVQLDKVTVAECNTIDRDSVAFSDDGSKLFFGTTKFVAPGTWEIGWNVVRVAPVAPETHGK